MRHDGISVKRFSRELKRLARKTKPEQLLFELRDNRWEPVKMHKDIHPNTPS